MPYYESAGPSRVHYRLQWRGATVQRQVSANVTAAANAMAKDILDYLHTNLHVYKDIMRPGAFAEVIVETGKRRIVRAGSDAPHTIFHELRYHPQLRETLDLFAPKVSQYLRTAFR